MPFGGCVSSDCNCVVLLLSGGWTRYSRPSRVGLIVVAVVVVLGVVVVFIVWTTTVPLTDCSKKNSGTNEMRIWKRMEETKLSLKTHLLVSSLLLLLLSLRRRTIITKGSSRRANVKLLSAFLFFQKVTVNSNDVVQKDDIDERLNLPPFYLRHKQENGHDFSSSWDGARAKIRQFSLHNRKSF